MTTLAQQLKNAVFDNDDHDRVRVALCKLIEMDSTLVAPARAITRYVLEVAMMIVETVPAQAASAP